MRLTIDLMRAAHLESEELQYEIDRRQSNVATDRPIINETGVEILQRWLDKDVQDGRQPPEWEIEFVGDGAVQDILRCYEQVTELTQLTIAVIRARDYDRASVLQSRLVHYFWRMRRTDDMGVPTVVNEKRLLTKQAIRSALVHTQLLLEQLENEVGEQIVQIDLPTEETNGPLNSTRHNGRENPEVVQRSRQMDVLEARYAPMRAEVGAWMVNGQATEAQLKMASRHVEAVAAEWQSISQRITRSEIDVLERLNALIRVLLPQQRWLGDELERRRAAAAYNTGFFPNGTIHTDMNQQSINAYSAAVDAMNLDESVRTTRPAHQTTAGVQFGQVPVYYSPPRQISDVSGENRTQGSHARNHLRNITPLQPNLGNGSAINSVEQVLGSSINSHSAEQNQSRLWPPTESNTSQQSIGYHPSGLLPSKNMERENASTNGSNNTSMGSYSLPGSIAQQMARQFQNRRYDGQSTDTKSIGVKEFVGRLRSMKCSLQVSDVVLLNNLDSVVTGLAWEWWDTYRYNVRTLDELEMQLGQRFGRMKMDMWSQRSEFASRKQGSDEYISDFIDEMCKRAHSIRPRLEEREIIQVIINNTNLRCQSQLLNRSFTTLLELRQHADFLGTRILSVMKTDRRLQPKRFVPRMAAVQSIENESDWEMAGSEAEVEEMGDDEMVTTEVGTMSRRVTSPRFRSVKELSRPKAETKKVTIVAPAQTQEAKRATADLTGTYNEVMELRCFGCNEPGVTLRNCTVCTQGGPPQFVCFGCGAPGVLKRNCERCNKNDSKNVSTHL